MDKYDVLKVVGQGSYGRAVLCKRRIDSKQCIIKQISLAKLSPKEAKLTEQEANLLSRLRHPNIVAFWESFVSRNQLHIVMEYADGGDLDNYVKSFSKSNRGKIIPERQVLNLFVQISLAIKHIHDRKILHRDLKSQNVFLTSSGLCKLGDFGVSKVLRNTVELASTQIGTPYYMSPEIMNNQRYNSKTDVWSLGCILYELMCQRLPFDGNSMKQLCYNIAHAQPAPPSSAYSTELRELVRDLLLKNPKQRPGINAILSRPVVRGRIASFLGETKIQTEFSHTVLHGVDVLRSTPQSQQPSTNQNGVRAASPAMPQPPADDRCAPPRPSSAARLEEIEQLRRQQQIARAKEAMAAQEKERQRLRAVERIKEVAADNERRAREQMEVQRRVREREIEIARIRQQQQQLAAEQRLAAKRKEAEAARIALYRRPPAGKPSAPEPARVVRAAPPSRQQPIPIPIPAPTPVVARISVIMDRAGNANPTNMSRPVVQQQREAADLSVRGSAVSQFPSPAVAAPVVSGTNRAPPVRMQIAPIPPFQRKEPPAHQPGVDRPPISGRDCRSQAADSAMQMAQDVLKVVQEQRSRINQNAGRRGPKPLEKESGRSNEDSDSSNEEPDDPRHMQQDKRLNPLPAGKVAPLHVAKKADPEPGPWFANLAEQMGQLQQQVRHIQEARSPQPPLPNEPVREKAVPLVKPSTPAPRSSGSRLSYPVSAQASSGSRAKALASGSTKSRESLPSSRAAPPRQKPPAATPTKKSTNATPVAPCRATTESNSSTKDPEARKAARSGFREFLKAQRAPASAGGDESVQVPSVCGIGSSGRDSFHQNLDEASIASSKSANSSAANRSPVPPTSALSSPSGSVGSSRDVLRAQHDAQRKELRRLMREQKQKLLRERENGWVGVAEDLSAANESSCVALQEDIHVESAAVAGLRDMMVDRDAAGRSSSTSEVAPVSVESTSMNAPQSIVADDGICVNDAADDRSSSPSGASEDVIEAVLPDVSLAVTSSQQLQGVGRPLDKSVGTPSCCDLLTNCLLLGKEPKVMPASPARPALRNNFMTDGSVTVPESQCSVVASATILLHGDADSLVGSAEDEALFRDSPLLGQTYIRLRSESCSGKEFESVSTSPITEDCQGDILVDEATALEYSMMLGQMQAILSKPSLRQQQQHYLDAPGSRCDLQDCVEDGEEEDDEFEEQEEADEDSFDCGDCLDGRGAPPEIPLSENYSDDEVDEGFVGGDTNGRSEHTGDVFAGLGDSDSCQLHSTLTYSKDEYDEDAGAAAAQNDISCFSDDDDEYGNGGDSGPSDPLSLVATPHIMDAVNQRHRDSLFVGLSDSYGAADTHLSSSALVDEEYLRRMDHMRHFLAHQLGAERFKAGMDFLATIHLAGSGSAGGDDEDDEALLNALEGVVGPDGLRYLDDMFQLIALEGRAAATDHRRTSHQDDEAHLLVADV